MILLSKRDEKINQPRRSYFMDPLASCDFMEWTRTKCTSTFDGLKRRFLSIENRERNNVRVTNSNDYTRWMPVNNIRQLEYIFMPIILEDSHFVLGLVHIKKKTTYVFDSLGCERKRLSFYLYKLMQQLFVDFGYSLGESDDDWRWVRNSYGPVQTNCCDCGLYVCLIANFILIGLGTPNIQSINAKEYHERVAVEIYEDTLI
jgi:hypothetical protein